MLYRCVLSAARCVWSLLFVAAVCSADAVANPPTIERLSVYGLQTGDTTSVVIDGTNLTSEARAFIPDITIARQSLVSLKPVEGGSATQRLELQLTLGSWAAPGVYDLRVVTKLGISNPLPVAVDAMPQKQWHAEIESLPVALSGAVNGNQTLSAKFTAKKSQTIVLEIEARRIGSQLRPVLHLYDDRHVQLAWAGGTPSLGDDARVVFTAPRDGEYSVELHDSRYAAPAPAHFRLKIGEFEYADVAIPAAVQVGTKQILRYAVSNLPAGSAAEFTAPSMVVRTPAAWPVRPMLSGPRPVIAITDEPQATEAITAESKDTTQLQELQLPGGVTGRLSQAREEDRYRLKASAGKKIRLALYAERIGSPLDGLLAVQTAKGDEIASADDGNQTSDPSLEFSMPKNAGPVTIIVKDVRRRGGDDFVYHLSAKLADVPDFSLSFEENRLQIPPNGNALLKVQAKRAGYNGPIRLRLVGLPPGIQVAEGEVPAGSDVGFCLLSGVGGGPAFGVVNIVGEGEIDSETIVRQALGPASGAAASCPWLRGDLGIAVTANPSPVSVELVGAPETLPTRLPVGGKLELPVEIRRAGDVAGDVRLSLVSTQRVAPPAPTPQQNRRGNRNRSMNAADAAKADLLRLGEERVFSPTTQATASVVVPSELPIGSYGLVVRGELLAADGKTVVATAYTRPRWLNAVIPFSVKLEQSNIQARAGEGETGELVGTIVRTDNYAGSVTLTIDGLPQGVIAPTHVVPAGESDFRFPVSLPFGLKSGPMKVKLESLGKASGDKAVDDGVVGKVVDVLLNVVPGEKPKMEKPLAIFEDEQEFVDELTEGEGVATLSDQEKYTGNTSLLAKQKPRWRTTIPGMSIKIRENPGPGEYRYLRFAWKGVGRVQRIGFQLIDDGQTNPDPKKVEKYTYYAGSGFSPADKTVVVDDKITTQWTVVTRDLFADFGELTITGIGAIYMDGKSVQYDHIYVGRNVADLDNVDVK
jgi:hypothetical protein